MTTTARPSKATTPAPDLETARAQRQELVDRMRRGDTTVTGGDFERAESAVRFAQLQEEVAADQAKEAERATRQDRQAELVQAIADLGASPTVDKATHDLARALDAFATTCRARNDRYADLVTQLTGLGDLPAGVSYHVGFSITVPGQVVRPVDVQEVIARAAAEAVLSHFPRTQIDFGQH